MFQSERSPTCCFKWLKPQDLRRQVLLKLPHCLIFNTTYHLHPYNNLVKWCCPRSIPSSQSPATLISIVIWPLVDIEFKWGFAGRSISWFDTPMKRCFRIPGRYQNNAELPCNHSGAAKFYSSQSQEISNQKIRERHWFYHLFKRIIKMLTPAKMRIYFIHSRKLNVKMRLLPSIQKTKWNILASSRQNVWNDYTCKFDYQTIKLSYAWSHVW